MAFYSNTSIFNFQIFHGTPPVLNAHVADLGLVSGNTCGFRVKTRAFNHSGDEVLVFANNGNHATALPLV